MPVYSREIRERRLQALKHQVSRLERRMRSLGSTSQRFAWVRFGIVAAGGFLTWLAASRGGVIWGWITFIASCAVLVAAAAIHQRLTNWIEIFQDWQSIKNANLARMELDWEHIQTLPLPADRPRTSLEIDLDISGPRSLHHLIDTAISREGSVQLLEWLTQPAPNLDEIKRRQPLVAELARLTRFRERLQLLFRQALKEPLEGKELLAWLEEGYPSDRLRWLLPLAAVFTFTNLSLFVLNSLGILPALWILSASVYLAIYFASAGMNESLFENIVRLDTELGKFRAILHYLERYPYGGNLHLEALCQPFLQAERLPSRQLRNLKLATAAIGLRMNPVVGLLLNMVTPWDFFFAHLSQRYCREVGELLPKWLKTWAELEALASLGGFAYLNPEYTLPEITPSAEAALVIKGLGHPLLLPERKVCNDFTIERLGEIAIITGSNMAGKSTFIKSVGINLCLAHAGGPVDAARLRARPMRMHTCIRISDSITDGFSYFYAEVKCLKKLLESLREEQDFPLLFLVDEIFRGTNNRERLIGSRTYLQAVIGENGAGLLATHDLELAGLAEQHEQIHNYHFRDFVTDGRLVFDYKIRRGPSPTTNALAIMRLEGLPVEPQTGFDALEPEGLDDLPA